MFSTAIKRVLYVLLFIFIILGGLFFWQKWLNNRDIPAIDSVVIEQHFNQSVAWLDHNYSEQENVKNPILWWMIKQASISSGNATLKNIYSRYKKKHLDPQAGNIWTPMFDELYRPRFPDPVLLPKMEDYQLFFLYALNCNKELGSEPVIQRQMRPEFCSAHYLHPRCITHQLMGLRFMQRYQCGFDDLVKSTINDLQQDVVAELSWDFRVTDAYIQRVLMLVDSGAYKKVKPLWIKNILEAQNTDGSWDDLYPLINLGNGKVFALTSTLPKIKKPEANFHTTAQAIWLLSLLLEDKQL